MGWQVVKQKDGRYAIWSTVVDSIIMFDLTREEVIKEAIAAIADSERAIARGMNQIMDELDKGGQPYYQFTLTRSQIDKAMQKARRRASVKAGPDKGVVKLK